jgi:hypothetical protein
MKKGLLALSAFIFATALVGCGADKEKNADNKDKAETTTVAEETTAEAEETTAEAEDDDSNEDENDTKVENTADPISLKDIAGPYHKNGHMYMGSYPDEYDTDALEATLKEDPITISEDGILHFCGKDYKLVEEGVNGEANIFSVEGSGFDMSKYKNNNCNGDKEYVGPCAVVFTKGHMTVNGEDYPYDEDMIYLKAEGQDSCFGYIYIEEGEGSDDDWGFSWDDDDDTTEE